MTWRIAFAGAQHETNTFAPNLAGVQEFLMADSWPRLLQGQEVAHETHGMNLPIAGALAEAQVRGDILCHPLLWCAAEPSGPVTDDAFDMIGDIILAELEAAGPVDALYLDLHGAMVTQSFPDGEGALLERLRAELGPDLPIGVSLDLHANLSARLIELADCITIYRTYPHLDMAATGARCLRRLVQVLEGEVFHPAFRQAPFLVPLHAQATGMAPCDALYRALEDCDSVGSYVDMALGFTAADIADCGPAVLAYANTPELASSLAESALARLCQAEPLFQTQLVDARSAVAKAQTMSGHGPVILADVQDNPGAGGASDTTGLLHAFIEVNAEAILGVLCDPEAAQQAHAAGLGQDLYMSLGAGSGTCDDPPLHADFKVLQLSDGQVPYSGEMYGGGIASLGPSALLHVIGTQVRVVVSSVRVQGLDRALFTHFGIEPLDIPLVGVKSTAHFRADFEPGARGVICVEASGVFPCRLDASRYRCLRPGMRMGPLGPIFGQNV